MKKSIFLSVCKTSIFAFLLLGCNSNSSNSDSSTEANSESPVAEIVPQDEPSQWIDLFEGASFDNWRGYLSDTIPAKGWNFDGDVLKLQREEGQPKAGDIITKEQYKNFELAFEFLLTEGANSGIFYGVVEKEGDPIFFNAPEFQLIDNHSLLATSDIPTLKTHLSGDCYDIYSSEKNLLNDAGEWNTGLLTSKNGQIEHWINGTKAISFQMGSDEWNKLVANSKFKDYPGFGDASVGHIGLQDHGSEIWFKNVKIRTY